jgi:hypothetical protein
VKIAACQTGEKTAEPDDGSLTAVSRRNVLKFAEIYDGLQFRERPKLVEAASEGNKVGGGFSII